MNTTEFKHCNLHVIVTGNKDKIIKMKIIEEFGEGSFISHHETDIDDEDKMPAQLVALGKKYLEEESHI